MRARLWAVYTSDVSLAKRSDRSDPVAEFVRRERISNGLTQAELAEIAGVSDRFVRQVEHGKPSIRLDVLAQLLKVFGARLTIERVQPHDEDSE